MGWETRRRGGRYYTRSRKVGGRVVREYVGAGVAGDLAEQEDHFERGQRQVQAARWHAERARLDAIERELADYCVAVGDLAREHLTTAGYHQHARGEWRRKRMAAKTPAKTADAQADVQADVNDLAKRAQHGDHVAMDSLRAKIAIAFGAQWETQLPRPAEHARGKMIEAALGGDLLMREAWERQADTMQRELAGPAATLLERLLCERIATCWLDTQLAEMLYAGKVAAGTTFAAGEYHQRRVDRAQRRYLDATLALARVRRLLAPVVAQVNIAQPGAQQLNIAQPASATPVAPAAPPVAVVTSPTWPPADARGK